MAFPVMLRAKRVGSVHNLASREMVDDGILIAADSLEEAIITLDEAMIFCLQSYLAESQGKKGMHVCVLEAGLFWWHQANYVLCINVILILYFEIASSLGIFLPLLV